MRHSGLVSGVLIIGALSGFLVPISGWSQESSTSAVSGQSSASQSTVAPEILNNLYLNYFTTYHGAPLNDVGSARAADRNGVISKTGLVNLDSEATAAYMITPAIGAGFVVPFLMVPVKGEDWILGDVGIKVFQSNTISNHGFVLATNLILQAPTSQASQARNMTYAIKTTPAVRYTFPNSRFSVGAWTEAKDYAGVTVDKAYKLYAEPYVSYKLMPKLSLSLSYEMEWHHDVHNAPMTFSTYQTDIQPGFIWNITQNIMLNPYFQVFTTNHGGYDSTALGAVLNARVL